MHRADIVLEVLCALRQVGEIWSYLRTRSFRQSLLILISPFLVRHLGLMSLVPGVVDSAVTDSSFALYQAYGDFIAFLLAFAAFALVRSGHRHALVAVWVFNVFGSLEFIAVWGPSSTSRSRMCPSGSLCIARSACDLISAIQPSEGCCCVVTGYRTADSRRPTLGKVWPGSLLMPESPETAWHSY